MGTTTKPSDQPFRQETHALGVPRLSLDKALAVAAALEDEETVRKLALSK